MEIKVQCACGAKFSFDIEPVDGQMPNAIACPKCGADTTNAANALIAQKSAATAPRQAASAYTPPARSRLKVAAMHETPTAPTSAEGQAAADSGAVMCSKHHNNIAETRCVNCDKPICMECMTVFGYFCSISCRYQAQQKGIPIPKCPHQRANREAMWWRKVNSVAGAVVMAVIGLLAVYVWFYFSGSRPKPFYKMSFNDSTAPLHARFLGKDKILLVKPDELVLHDIKTKKDVWMTAFAQLSSTNAPADAPAETTTDEDSEGDSKSLRGRSNTQLFFSKDYIWLTLGGSFVCFESQTGAAKQTISLPGRVISSTGDSNSVMFICDVDDPVDPVAKNSRGRQESRPSFKRAIFLVNLDSGETKTEQAVGMPTQRDWVNEELPAGASPTSAVLLEQELKDEPGKRQIKTLYSRFVPSGANAVEMQVRLAQANMVSVESIKKPRASAINENTSVTSSGAVAEEVFNDIARSRTGGMRQVDESRYVVSLKRLMAEGVQPWTAEVTGPPALFPMKTVDVLVAGKDVYIFDKQNNKTGEAKLTYTVDEFVIQLAPLLAPCVEDQGVLFFFDQGVLTAFELPSGSVKWRLPSVGISKVLPDGKGNLYVNTTTASPEDIQYSDQIKINDQARPLLLKVEAASGKILWKAKQIGMDSALSGKFLYTLSAQTGGGPGLAVGLSEALGSSMGGGAEHFHLYRVNPSSGKEKWDYYNRGAPVNVDFDGNRILLQFPYEVRVLKYLTMPW